MTRRVPRELVFAPGSPGKSLLLELDHGKSDFHFQFKPSPFQLVQLLPAVPRANVLRRSRLCWIPQAGMDVLDHATNEIASGSKLGIDATKKIPGEGLKRPWLPLIKMDAAVMVKVEKLFRS